MRTDWRKLRGAHGAAGESETLRLRFGAFGWELLREATEDSATGLGAFIGEACRTYRTRLFRSTLSLETPFLSAPGAPWRDLEISVSTKVWADLRLEAGRQGVELERLIEHAVFLHLALRPRERRDIMGMRRRFVPLVGRRREGRPLPLERRAST